MSGAATGGTAAPHGVVAAAGTVAPLWRRLFDDAAVFPPGNAAFGAAAPAYAARSRTALGGYVGPFIAPAGRWAEFTAALPGGAPASDALRGDALRGDALPGDALRGDAAAGGRLELSVTLPADRSVLATLLDAAGAEPRVALRSVEVAPAGTGAGLAEVLAALGDLLPESVTGYLEVPLGAGFADAAAAVASAGYRIKVRTGGTTAEAFPGAEDLAAALATCVRLSLPFKLTAGLHNALRHRDPRTGFEHHGFLNVLAALDAALTAGPGAAGPGAAGPDAGQGLGRSDAAGQGPGRSDAAGQGPGRSDAAGQGPGAMAAILDDTDPARIGGRIAAMPPERVRRVRELFTSFGTCSIDEPLGDLVSLGLIEQETA